MKNDQTTYVYDRYSEEDVVRKYIAFNFRSVLTQYEVNKNNLTIRESTVIDPSLLPHDLVENARTLIGQAFNQVLIWERREYGTTIVRS